MTTIESLEYIPLKLDPRIQEYANHFASRQPTLEKSKQVYLNTLAVCAVHSYLRWMDFKTDPMESDSFNQIYQTFQNVADLSLTGYGNLECRPIAPGETTVKLPPEVRENRLACIVVLIEEGYDKVKILGAYLSEDQYTLPETIKLSQLKTCSELVDYLEELEPLDTDENIEEPEPSPTDFDRHVQTIIEESIPEIKEIYPPEKLAEIVAKLENCYRNSHPIEHLPETRYILKSNLPKDESEFTKDSHELVAIRKNQSISEEEQEEIEEKLSELAPKLMKKIKEVFGLK